jgi:preprotein translocase subunit SecF
MLRPLRLVRDTTSIDFLRHRRLGFAVSLLLVLATLVALPTLGLNLGIDFLGGILVEARAAQPVDMAALRARLQGLSLGEVKLQQIDRPTDVLVRVQEPRGGMSAQEVAGLVRAELIPDHDIRRTEIVGPTIGHELLMKGLWATVLSLAGITVYLMLRFDWPFAVAALITTAHDVLVTLGLYAVLQLEFNLTSVAALLTLAGYSINDTVVVFDRIRENLRRHKGSALLGVINASVNQTLSRTINTSLTTLLAVAALLVLGGPTLRGLGIALAFGILIGTFSSVFVAAALLPLMRPRSLPEPPSPHEPAPSM